MGCNIYAILEKKNKYGRWINKGDPEIIQNYQVFSILANVRNDDNMVYISKPKGIDRYICSKEFRSLIDCYKDDAHSISWINLQEIKKFNIKQILYNNQLICGEKGYELIYLKDEWHRLINRMKALKKKSDSDEDIRIVFFFIGY